jgi:MFS family permease
MGPTLGGIMIDEFNWRAIFYVAVPVVAVGMLMGGAFLPERDEDAGRARFDFAGFVLLSMALTSLLTGLSSGQREGWQSDYILGLFAAAIASTLGFFAWGLIILK